ncbi:phage head-tail joining protein [Microvirga arsenatis]|uniref:Phage tail protein n=1 Tax=Microvirga arsenatis TaxID=2692265 RepID=A0ABW9Z0A5_9HYPH|nr:hypothetical protein [Microvirga arsenatis]NBJ13212.1 hypothetical protein [Microvirga arsenatis]NBJ25150.1 hypothetical protein [Microvirga arsenatis]
MAFSQNDIDTLKRAIATGALKVRYADGRETTFRSLKEMRETLEMMETEVRGEARIRTSFASFERD